MTLIIATVFIFTQAYASYLKPASNSQWAIHHKPTLSLNQSQWKITKTINELGHDLNINYSSNNQPCIEHDGEYLNLCGNCINSETQNEIDLCGVCRGRNVCRSCANTPGSYLDGCGNCLKTNDERWNNCTRITSVLPKVIDLAVINTPDISILLNGVGLTESSLPDLSCVIITSNTTDKVKVKNAIVNKEEITIIAEQPKETGDLTVACNSSNTEVELQNQNIIVINSKILKIISIVPNSAKVGQEIQVSMAVRGITAPVEVICYFILDYSLVSVLPTNQVQGNSLVSNITCPNYTAKRAGSYTIGIAYTYDAVKSMNRTGGRITVEADSPVPINGGFKEDLRQMWIQFDNNISGESECQSIFSYETYHLLGSGAQCNYISDTLWITFGKNATINLTDKIKVKPGQIWNAYGNPGYAKKFKGNIQMKINSDTRKANKPVYKLIGPNYVCPGEKLNPHLFTKYRQNNSSLRGETMKGPSFQIMIRQADSQEVKYNVSIGFELTNSSEDGKTEPGGRQRRNLMLWFSVREMGKQFQSRQYRDKLQIYNILITPNVLYTVSVTGKNRFGIEGDEKKLTFQIADTAITSSGRPLQVLVSGPSHVNVDSDTWIEAKVVSPCASDFLLKNAKFSWKIKSNGNTTMDLSSCSGPKLLLPAGSLKGDQHYKVSCFYIGEDNSSSDVNGSTEFQTNPARLSASVALSNMVIRTGQQLELLATTNLIGELGEKIQFQWSCEYNNGKCYTPGPNSTVFEQLFSNEFQKKILKIKAGFLAVGRYKFKVKAFWSEENVASVAEPSYVTVISGDNPRIRILKYIDGLIDPSKGLEVPVRAYRLSPGCILSWDFERVKGFEYLDLKSMGDIKSISQVPLNTNENTQKFSLKIPGNVSYKKSSSMILKGSANYKLTASVLCPNGSSTSLSTVFHKETIPVPEKLMVTPQVGTALVTQFTFTTERAYAPTYDHPITYSFGYLTPSGQLQFIYTSSEWLTTEVVMPAGNLKSVLRVCNVRNVCAITEGANITTSMPESISPLVIQSLMTEYSRLLFGKDYNEALSLASSSLQTLNNLSDRTAYVNVSEHVLHAITDHVNTVSKSLEKTTLFLKSAINLLDTGTSTMQYIPSSDLAISSLVNLRRRILIASASIKRDGESTLLATSEINISNDLSSIRTQNRIKKYPPIVSGIRSRRQTETIWNNNKSSSDTLSIDMVKIMVKASEMAILNFRSHENAISELKELIQNTEKYISSICHHTVHGAPFFLGTKVISLSVQKIYPNALTYEEWVPLPNCLQDCNQKISHVKLRTTQEFHSQNSDDLCLGGVILPKDYLSQVYNLKSEVTEKERWSNIYFVTMLENFEHRRSIDTEDLIIKIPLRNMSVPQGFKPQCYTTNLEKGWTKEYCITAEFKDNELNCHCPLNEYVSVFILNKTEEDTRKGPEKNNALITHELSHVTETSLKTDWELLPLKSPEISFRIEEDYQKIVGLKRIEFEDKIRSDIAEQMDIPLEVIAKVSVSPGSILVTVQMESVGQTSVNKVVPRLIRALNYGELVLKGFDGNQLSVPPQLLKITERQTQGELSHFVMHLQLLTIYKPYKYEIHLFGNFSGEMNSYGPLIFTGAGIIVCALSFTILVSTALYVKRKRDKLINDVTQKQTDSNLPKYRELYLEESVSGTERSLLRYQHYSGQPLSACPFILPSSSGEQDSGIGIANQNSVPNH